MGGNNYKHRAKRETNGPEKIEIRPSGRRKGKKKWGIEKERRNMRRTERRIRRAFMCI